MPWGVDDPAFGPLDAKLEAMARFADAFGVSSPA